MLLANNPVRLTVAELPEQIAALLEVVDERVGATFPVPETGMFCVVVPEVATVI